MYLSTEKGDGYKPVNGASFGDAPWHNTNTITSVNISGPIYPTYLNYWFYGCSALNTIDLTNLNTSKAVDMSYMFGSCTALTTLDLSSFNTSNVTDMSCMFGSCTALTTLDLSSFNTSNVINMFHMFYNCGNLKTIYASETFTTANVSESNGMFDGCNSLKGYVTPYVGRYRDKTYAHYFVEKDVTSDIYAWFYPVSDAITYDLVVEIGPVEETKSAYKEAEKVAITDNTLDLAATSTHHPLIRTVTFSDSVKDSGIRPKNFNQWFRGNVNLTSITNLGYLDTSAVTDMSNMFNGSLEDLDTSSVINMDSLFQNCSSLTYTSLGDIGNVKSMNYMFAGCSNLLLINWTDDDNASVTEMKGMFQGCRSIIHICDVYDVLFDNAIVTTMESMFEDCVGLGKDPDDPDVFLSDLAVFNVQNMSNMFKGCTSLTNVYFSVYEEEGKKYGLADQVIDMSGMFQGCTQLSTLDISGQSFSNVTNTANMFDGCINLKFIYATAPLTCSVTSTNMFRDCTSLVGGRGTEYSTDKLDATYARVDDSAAAGYFTSPLYYSIKPLEENTENFVMSLFSSVMDALYDYEEAFGIAGGFYDSAESVPWNNYCDQIITVEIVDKIAPASINHWFDGFTELTAIYAPENLDLSSSTVTADAVTVFDGCVKLPGYDKNNLTTKGKSYAHINGLNNQPGYFTVKSES